MAFTKIVSPGIDTTGSYTVQELNTVGIVTAGTVQVGAATTVHTTGIDLGSGNITSHNINSTGIITATSFVGPVTGNITGDITATSGTFSGNVSIGGTLTYEDVTNIDAVGIITAQSDVSIADKIIHTGDTDTAIRFPAADTFSVETAGSERLRIDSNGHFKAINGSTSNFNTIQRASTSNYSGIRIQDADATQRMQIGVSGGTNNIATGSAQHDVVLKSYANLLLATNATERLRITSDGNVGINATTFAANGTNFKVSDGTISRLALDKTGANARNFEIGNFGTGLNVYDVTADEERLRITSAGNVDINGTPPWSVTGGNYRNLSISGNDASSSGFLWLGNGAAATNADFDLGRINYVNGSTIVAQIKGTTQTSANDDGRISFFTKTSGSNISERLRITSDGKIGIPGQAESAALLGVNAASTVEMSDSSGLYNQSNPCYIQIKNTTDAISDPECGIILQPRNSSNGSVAIFAKRTGSFTSDLIYRVRTGSATSAERLRIGSDGSVYIGKTSTSRSTNGFAYYVGTNNDDGTLLLANGRTSGGSPLEINRINSDGNAISFYRSGTSEGTIMVSTSGTTYNTTSDIRLKTDINPISDATDKLMNMNPVTHKWKEDPDGDTVHGFIAQEMQKISPESVHGKPDGEIMMGMDYGRITPIIVAALQDAIKEINTLKQRISELGG